MIEQFTHPVVSLIVEHPTLQGHVLLQRRSKEREPPFKNLFELPQGRIRDGELLLECAVRELYEEANLTLTRSAAPHEEIINGERLQSMPAFVVSEAGLRSYIAICLVVSAAGIPRGSLESSDPLWRDKISIENLLRDDRIFPLNVPMLRWYLGVG